MHTIYKSGPDYKNDFSIYEVHDFDYKNGFVFNLVEDIGKSRGLVELETLSLSSTDSSLVKSIIRETCGIRLIPLLRDVSEFLTVLEVIREQNNDGNHSLNGTNSCYNKVNTWLRDTNIHQRCLIVRMFYIRRRITIYIIHGHIFIWFYTTLSFSLTIYIHIGSWAIRTCLEIDHKKQVGKQNEEHVNVSKLRPVFCKQQERREVFTEIPKPLHLYFEFHHQSIESL